LTHPVAGKRRTTVSTVGTVQASRLLTERTGRRVYPVLLCSMIASGRIEPPRKNSTGGYEWSEADLAAAEKELIRTKGMTRTKRYFPDKAPASAGS
jgi:hypothetical protein